MPKKSELKERNSKKYSKGGVKYSSKDIERMEGSKIARNLFREKKLKIEEEKLRSKKGPKEEKEAWS